MKKRLIKKSSSIEVYHGTSSDLADSILSTGLKPFAGGDGDGAYVSTDWEDAKCYAIARAGEKRNYSDQLPEFIDVYPIMIVLNTDTDRLKQGFNTNMFAPDGIQPSDIKEVIDLSDEEHFVALLKYIELKDIDDLEADNYYQQYMNYVFKYI